MMNHADGWMMNGWMGGGLWIWTVGVLVVVLLIVLISRLSKR